MNRSERVRRTIAINRAPAANQSISIRLLSALRKIQISRKIVLPRERLPWTFCREITMDFLFTRREEKNNTRVDWVGRHRSLFRYSLLARRCRRKLKHRRSASALSSPPLLFFLPRVRPWLLLAPPLAWLPSNGGPRPDSGTTPPPGRRCSRPVNSHSHPRA